MVFKTHFDIGFTDLSSKVIDQYAKDMLKDVIATCEATGHMGELKYVWTMPSWPLKIMEEYCEEKDKKKLEQLIEKGQVVWHALPFTSHYDFCGIEDYIHGIKYAKELSDKYNKPMPISAKMTDVPGHGWTLPTILSGAGIKFLHLGCNGFATPPNVPPLFYWESPSGERLLTMYQKGGYGSSLLPPKDWPYPVWMALMHTHDNLGPQSAEMIEEYVREAQKQCPDAEIVCGTMEDFYKEIIALGLTNLPIVKGDLADTWIHGSGSYPKEVSIIRDVSIRIKKIQKFLALHKNSISNEISQRVEKGINKVYDNIILFGEHTWGLDVKTWLGSGRVYEKKEFLEAKETPKYKYMEQSWEEQKKRANQAIQECEKLEKLLKIDMVSDVNNEKIPKMDTQSSNILLSDAREDYTSSAESLAIINRPEGMNTVENHRYRMEFSNNGVIHGIYDKKLKTYLLKEKDGVGVFSYRYDKYGIEDVTSYLRAYGYRFSDWGINDNGRQDYPETEHETYYPELIKYKINGNTIIFSYRGTGDKEYGDANEIELCITFPKEKDELIVKLNLYNKPETPYIESGTFQLPLGDTKPKYYINKNGCVIRPEKDIVENANHIFYALEKFVAAEENNIVCVVSKDVPLMAIGETGVYQFRNRYKENEPIFCFNLFNNMWGTNFPQWIGGSFSYQFIIFGEEKGKLKDVTKRALELEEESTFAIPEHMHISLIEPAGRGFNIRLREIAGEERMVTFSYPNSKIYPVDLLGRTLTKDADKINDLKKEYKDKVTFKVRPFGLYTFYCEENIG